MTHVCVFFIAITLHFGRELVGRRTTPSQSNLPDRFAAEIQVSEADQRDQGIALWNSNDGELNVEWSKREIFNVVQFQFSTKQAKEMYEHALKLESEYRQYISGKLRHRF